MTVKVATRAATVFESSRACGDTDGPGVHSHPGFDETFYVLDGEWVFHVGSQRIDARTGDLVHIARGEFHAFHSAGREPGRLLAIATPGGIERFFEEAQRVRDDDVAGRSTGIHFARSEPRAEELRDSRA